MFFINGIWENFKVVHLNFSFNSSPAEKDNFSKFVEKTQHLQGWQGV